MTAFPTCYSKFQYLDMPCGLTNASASFHSYIEDSLQRYINDFTVYYLDEILIYLTNNNENEEHVQKVFERLWEFGLYYKGVLFEFGISEVGIV